MQSVHTQLDTFLRQTPRIPASAFVAPGAILVGDIALGEHSSIWYNAVLRGDINRIVVGDYTNIQDLAMVHVADAFPTTIGRHVTIGHTAIIHACTIGDESLIGMGAVILDGAVIGNQCLVGAKALVTQGTKIPDGSLVLGSPAKIARSLTAQEIAALRASAEHYAANAEYNLALRPRGFA